MIVVPWHQCGERGAKHESKAKRRPRATSSCAQLQGVTVGIVQRDPPTETRSRVGDRYDGRPVDISETAASLIAAASASVMTRSVCHRTRSWPIVSAGTAAHRAAPDIRGARRRALGGASVVILSRAPGTLLALLLSLSFAAGNPEAERVAMLALLGIAHDDAV
jgi:hypothetical protein